MWMDKLLSSKVTQGIAMAAQFAEQRHKLLAENVANIDTPDYHTGRLDQGAFESALRKAFDRADQTSSKALDLRGNKQVSTAADGSLVVQPSRDPAPNILFHDGSNAMMETLMSDVQSNALRYRFSTTMLRGRFDGLLNAIRGRTQ